MRPPLVFLMGLVAMVGLVGPSCKEAERDRAGRNAKELAQPLEGDLSVEASIRGEVEDLRKATARLREAGASIQEMSAARMECDALVVRLGSRGDDAVPALAGLLQKEDDALTRTYAVKALARTRAESAVPVLMKVVQDGETHVRKGAVSAIRDFSICKNPVLPKGRGAGLLLDLTKDRDPLIRKEAIWCLLGFYEYPVLQRLEALTQDGNAEVRQAAADVSKRVVGIREELDKKGSWRGEKPLLSSSDMQ
jgi:HEAT repeat protein